MVRIGFAYNVKPDTNISAPPGVSEFVGGDEVNTLADAEPPSTGSPLASRSKSGGVAEQAQADDEFAEWDTWETVNAVADALAALGEVIHLEARSDFPERLKAERPDIVFNMAEGSKGKNRESLVPAICEFHDIPYSGSDPLTLALCLDKARTKEVLSYYGIPTPAFAVVECEEEIAGVLNRLRYPLFVKPIHEGSSKGITEGNYCPTPADLAAQTRYLLETYNQPVLIEEFLPGAEYTCAVLGNGAKAQVLPIVGLNFDALPAGALHVYGFEAKWVWDRPEAPLQIFDCPAVMPAALRKSVEETSLKAYRSLGCRDWSRVDLRLDARGVPNVIEVNPLPGILPDPAGNSCFPKAARAAGMNYEALIQACITAAAERYGLKLGRAGRAG